MRLTLPRRLIDNVLRRRRTRLGRGCQRGQVIVVAVGVMALSLGAIMISVDAGWWLRDKRDAQNDADAIALAAAQELPDRVAAELRGEDGAVANGVDPSTEMAPPDCADGVLQGNFCFIDLNADGDDDKVRVKVSRPSNSFIAEALGVGTPTLNPPAAASKLNAVASCIMPWGIVAGEDPPPANQFYGLNPIEHLYTFQDTEHNAPGNYGAISIYGTGADIYKDVISSDGCPEPKSNACAPEGQVGEYETLEDCDAKTGKLGNTTNKALNERYAYELSLPGGHAYCDADTFLEAQNNGGGILGQSKSPCEKRGVPLGIINSFPPGGASADIEVYGIAIFYIAGWSFPPDDEKGYVWGYLLEDIPATPAWEIEWDVSDNPFAPVGFFLVE